MSTYFKELNPIFSSIDVKAEGNHVRITLFIEHQNIGTLVLSSADEVYKITSLFFSESDVVHRTSNAIIKFKEIADDRPLLSEYGDLTTFADIQREFKPMSTK